MLPPRAPACARPPAWPRRRRDDNRRELDLRLERYIGSTAVTHVAPAAAEAAIVGLCRSGHTLIVGTSISFEAGLFAAAERAECAAARMLWVGGFRAHPRVSPLFARVYQPRWLGGVLAGAQLLATGGSTVGYVAAFPYAEVLRGLNAFALGCQQALAACRVRVVWVGSWNDPLAIRAAAQKLYVEDEVDAVSYHVDLSVPAEVFRDGPPVCAALRVDPDLGRTTVCMSDGEAAALARKPARFSIGYRYDLAAVVCESLLATAVINWANILEPVVRRLFAGEWRAGASIWDGGLGQATELARRSSAVQDAAFDVFAYAEDALQLVGDADRIFCDGPIARADGSLVAPLGGASAGRASCLSDAQLLSMDYYVRGVADALPTAVGGKWGRYTVGASPWDSAFTPPSLRQLTRSCARPDARSSSTARATRAADPTARATRRARRATARASCRRPWRRSCPTTRRSSSRRSSSPARSWAACSRSRPRSAATAAHATCAGSSARASCSSRRRRRACSTRRRT